MQRVLGLRKVTRSQDRGTSRQKKLLGSVKGGAVAIQLHIQQATVISFHRRPTGGRQMWPRSRLISLPHTFNLRPTNII